LPGLLVGALKTSRPGSKEDFTNGNTKKLFAGNSLAQTETVVIDLAETLSFFGKGEVLARVTIPNPAARTAVLANGLVFGKLSVLVKPVFVHGIIITKIRQEAKGRHKCRATKKHLKNRGVIG